MGSSTSVEVAVIGGGPAGLTAAIALASAGIETAVVSRRSTEVDNRTTALLVTSVAALTALDVWETCAQHAAALRRLRLIDDTKRLLRAPEVLFDAAEIGLDAFGFNIENQHLLAALEARIAQQGARLTRIDDIARHIVIGDAQARVELSGGATIAARLLVAADGARSLCRQVAGIPVRCETHPQAALTVNFCHTRPHRDTSTEFHTESGPVTQVPLKSARSSLVYVVRPHEADRLTRLDGPTLSDLVEQRLHSILGTVSVEAGRGLFRLRRQIAERFAGERIALVGEAAHVIPPIGAQGLNLGLRDAAALAELIVAEHRRGQDVGDARVLARYDAERRGDVRSRATAVDLLNRSLLSDFLPVHGLRGLGLFLLERVGPLRRALMREGVAPTLAEPRLMRGEAL